MQTKDLKELLPYHGEKCVCLLCEWKPEIEKYVDHAIQSAIKEREKEMVEKIELIKKETQDQLKKCNNSNATSFAEDGGEHLVGRLDLCDELLNSLSELYKKEKGGD